MIPTEEETARIQDAMQENPDVPLGNAEQFMLTLSSVSELRARLHLWSFKLDYEIQEKVIDGMVLILRQRRLRQKFESFIAHLFYCSTQGRMRLFLVLSSISPLLTFGPFVFYNLVPN